MNVEVNHPKLSVNFGAERVYPELEDLEITPSLQKQTFKSDMYGYNLVNVNAIESEELTVTPTSEKQVFDGLYNKVTIEGAELADDIKLPVEFNATNVGGIIEIALTGNNVFTLRDTKTAIITVFEENKISMEEKETPYEELNGIEFTGTQYFDTQFPLWSYTNWAIELDITPTKLHDWSHLLSYSNSSATHEVIINSSGNYNLQLNNKSQTITKVTANTRYKFKHEYSNGTVKSYVNNVLQCTTSHGTVNTSNNIRFGRRDSEYYIGYLHSLKFYADGEIVRDYIPVKNENGVVCFYDLVTGKYFYNSGTGNFNAG